MEIKRNTEGLTINLTPYKISIKKLDTNKNSYQYTCILPPFICSLFNITKDSAAPSNKFEELYNRLVFYSHEGSLYLEDSKVFSEISNIKEVTRRVEYLKKKQYKYDNVAEEIEELTKDLGSINNNIIDNIYSQYFSTPYLLSNGNSFRFTLPNKLVKDEVNVNQDNYILYSINTNEKNVLNNYGTIKIDILKT